jgi:hypothetical protein
MQLINWLISQCLLQLKIVFVDLMHVNMHPVASFGFEKLLTFERGTPAGAEDPVGFLAFHWLASLVGNFYNKIVTINI